MLFRSYVILGGVYYALSTSTNLTSVGARTVSVSEGKAVYEIIKDPILVVQNQYKVTYQKDNATSGNAPTDSNSYSGTGTVTVLGNSGSLAINGYSFSGWCKTATTLGNTCSGTKYSQNDTFSISNADVSLYPVWTRLTYTITASAGTGGSISSSGNSTINYGGSKSYTITANTGYSISTVTVDSVSQGNISSYSFTNVQADHTIAATFSALTFSISFNTATGGSASASPSSGIAYNGSVNLTASPSTGYTFSSWSCSAGSVGSSTSSTTTLSGIVTDITCTPSFTANIYTVTYNANGGSVGKASDSYTVGTSSPITFPTPTRTSDGSANYSFTNWYDADTGGNIVSSPYTPTANITVYAHWTTSLTWTLTTDNQSYTSGGSVPTLTATASPSAGLSSGSLACYVYSKTETNFIVANRKTIDTSLPAGEYKIRCSGTPAAGYAEATLVDGVLTVTVNTYTITVTAPTNGSITPGTTTVNEGANQNFTIAANSGYEISVVTVDGTGSGSASTYSFTNVTANHTITATMSPLTITITFNGNGSGVTSVPTAQSGSYGTSITLSSTQPAQSNYTFRYWTFDSSGSGTTYAPGASLTLPTSSQIGRAHV